MGAEVVQELIIYLQVFGVENAKKQQEQNKDQCEESQERVLPKNYPRINNCTYCSGIAGRLLP